MSTFEDAQKRHMEEHDTEINRLLPQTEEALDLFVQKISKIYGFPIGDDTYDAIATMIMHMPHTKASAPYSYFGEGVQKQLANRAAYNRLREIAERRKKAEEEKAALEKTKTAALTLVSGETTSASGSESI